MEAPWCRITLVACLCKIKWDFWHPSWFDFTTHVEGSALFFLKVVWCQIAMVVCHRKSYSVLPLIVPGIATAQMKGIAISSTGNQFARVVVGNHKRLISPVFFTVLDHFVHLSSPFLPSYVRSYRSQNLAATDVVRTDFSRNNISKDGRRTYRFLTE